MPEIHIIRAHLGVGLTSGTTVSVQFSDGQPLNARTTGMRAFDPNEIMIFK